MFLQAILICLASLFRSGGFVGHLYLYLFAFASGITLNPIINHYVGRIGGEVVVLTFFITTLIFIVLGIIGYTRKEPIIDFQAIISVVCFTLIILMVAINFFPLDNKNMWIATIIGIIVFSGHTIYIFNRIAYSDLSDENIPLLALVVGTYPPIYAPIEEMTSAKMKELRTLNNK